MKKLILFVHGLGGSKETWGEFPKLIEDDNGLKEFVVEIYEYPTSLLRPRSIVSKFSKLLSWIIPQTTLPKIQDIAKALETDLRNSYSEYDEIYLITHSMGGLVARQYLNVLLDKAPEKNRVKKLLIYAVPNNGSDLALLEKIYEHTQIKQMSKSSDFIEFLNDGDNIKNLKKYVDTLYVVGLSDAVVDKQSASSHWGNENCEHVHKGHLDIVKPKSVDDISYVIFRNFVTDKKLLNSSEKIFFESSSDNIDANRVREILVELKSDGEKICNFLDDELKISWDYYSGSVLNRLFWKNLMLNANGYYQWRNEATKEMAKEVFGC